MSTTLHVFRYCLDQARKFHELGRLRDALAILGRLANFRRLPNAVLGEVRGRMAEIELQLGEHRKARRHLTVALASGNDKARHHQLLAQAIEDDTNADESRALDHYRESLQLDANQPAIWAKLGQLALRIGEIEEGVMALRRAAELAADDPQILRQVTEGLIDAGQVDEARRGLQAARFRNPRDQRFKKLWNEFQFHQLHDQQQKARRRQCRAPVLLPFLRVTCGPESTPCLIREDGPASLSPPHRPRHSPLTDRRHA
jgi:tetratricopeptide (TPR) repeat protein